MAVRVDYFDTWRPAYSGATVHIKAAADDTDIACFFDYALTDPAPNPQTLASYSQAGISYGKFSRPIYVGAAYYLVVNSIDVTGIIDPSLISLDGEDAGNAVVTPTGGSEGRELDELFADTVVVKNQGNFLPTSNTNASSSENNTTLNSAIGLSSSRGGGYPMCPDGVYEFVSVSVPSNMVLSGRGKSATTLQSAQADEVITLSGDSAGLKDITIDGVSNQASSKGVYFKSRDYTRIEDAMVKRFATGIQVQGGRYSRWRNIDIDSCNIGVLLHGDNDASGGADGDECIGNHINGGIVSFTTITGIELKDVDKKCWHNSLSNLFFRSNIGTALKIVGARYTTLEKVIFEGNTTDISISDATDVSRADENTVVGFHMRGGRITGNMNFAGKCQDIIFEGVEFVSGTYTLTGVQNNIVCIDCIESPDVVIAGGDATKWTRARRQLSDSPNSSGVTTDAVATEAWSYNLAPGEKIHCLATVIANGRNTIDYAMYHIGQTAQRPGSTLAYDAQTTNFVLGQKLTGATSGATARIVADADGGTTGTLTLRDIVGEFQDNEAITDGSGGAAVANGVLAHQPAALIGSTSIEVAAESDAAFACVFGATADEVRVLVTGAAAKTVEWTVSVKVTSG